MNGHVAADRPRLIEIADGDGCRLIGRDGKRYLDFVAGWCVGNVGWKRKEIRAAIEREAARGVYAPPLFKAGQDQEEFAALLAEHAPNPKLTAAFRCTSGSEAVEFAIKAARAATRKPVIVSIDGVYHGHTYGAASVGDACAGSGMEPCLPEFIKIPMPDAYRGVSSADVVRRFDALARSRDDIAAFFSEPAWTNAGAYVPPPDFYPAIERICRDRGILFCLDEVATGFGRCGTLFASELWGVRPDIVCLGKGMTGGYASVGATLVTEDIAASASMIPTYSTFGWLRQDLAAARANVEIILRDRLWENSKRVGERLLAALKPLEDLPFVGEVRGVGLLIGIEIVRDTASKEPDWRNAVVLQDRCADQGLLIETAGNTLFITPPLILTDAEADEGAAILTRVLEDLT